MKKATFYIFVILHLLFVGVAMYESKMEILQITFLSLLLLLLVYFYVQLKSKDSGPVKWRDSFELFFCIAGALATYFLQLEFEISAVIAAGSIGLIASFLPYLQKNSQFLSKFPAVIYCGAFVGMTPPELAGSSLFIVFAALSAGILLILSRSHLNGFGGKLGTIAFGGVTTVSAIIYLFAQ